MSALETAVQYIKGVGPKKAYRLGRLGLKTIEDVLYYLPKDYEDKRSIATLSSVNSCDKRLFKVKVKSQPVTTRPRKGLTILKVHVEDQSGEAYLVWFNQEFLRDRFQQGKEYLVYGKLKRDSFGVQIQNPDFKLWDGNERVQGITPVYGLTEGISNKEMIKIVSNAISAYIGSVPEVMPSEISRKYGFTDKKQAIKQIHYPDSPEARLKARDQLAFEELLILQLGLLQMKKSNTINDKGIVMLRHEKLDGFIDNLDFRLTIAQQRVLEEIIEDMGRNRQMNRLVQGDVGSGKTIVGIIAMYNAVLNGYQATMMAPTEILAIQHFETLNKAFVGHDVKIAFLSGNQSRKEKESVLSDLASGEIDIIVGTHALIQDGVNFKNLGVAITDEQHRFGVRQRLVLADKGEFPDVMVMTATPIPRTLALILYGDLDISIIDELPPGRREIRTYAVNSQLEDRIFKFISTQVGEGRQAYIVCPLIEESESIDVVSAEELFQRLKEQVFPDLQVALLHGKMSQRGKDEIMMGFKGGSIDILVSTTVVEVGVNVPNASIMLIMNAERFGLAQLHQLRGRVGRGEYQSHCILINDNLSKLSRERMRIMQSTTDGFKISEKDLELRGPGEFFGTRQHGLPELRVANLIRDMEILEIAQKEAIQIIEADNWQESNDYSNLRASIERLFNSKSDEFILN